MKKLFAGILALAALTFGAPAMAWDGHRGHGYSHGGYSHDGHYGSHSSFGFYVGLPLFWPRFDYYQPYYSYPYPYSYPSTQVIVERQPQVYVQRETTEAAAPAASGYWYYCPDSKTYYPYAQTCPSPWLQVIPQTNPVTPR